MSSDAHTTLKVILSVFLRGPLLYRLQTPLSGIPPLLCVGCPNKTLRTLPVYTTWTTSVDRRKFMLYILVSFRMRLITRHENLESDGTEANLVLNNYTKPANTPSVYKPKYRNKNVSITKLHKWGRAVTINYFYAMITISNNFIVLVDRPSVLP